MGHKGLLWMTALLTGILCFAPVKETSALSLDEILANMQSIYEKTDDLKANFIQEVTIKSMNRTEREEGVFYFKNPRRMVWDYTKPKAKKLVINPKTAWFYIPEDSAVYIQDADSVFKSRIGIRFLSGMGKIQEDFHIAFSSPDHADREGNYLLKLTPKEPDFGVGELLLTVNKESFHISRLSFSDTYGNATRLHFRNLRINNKLPEKMFTFIPPSGAEVYNAR
jgi:outer membrane lipoprotein carrier protein